MSWNCKDDINFTLWVHPCTEWGTSCIPERYTNKQMYKCTLAAIRLPCTTMLPHFPLSNYVLQWFTHETATFYTEQYMTPSLLHNFEGLVTTQSKPTASIIFKSPKLSSKFNWKHLGEGGLVWWTYKHEFHMHSQTASITVQFAKSICPKCQW